MGRLWDALIASRTVRRYCLVVEKFLDFIAVSKLPMPTSLAAIDQTVCMHIENLWAEGDGNH
jgi:hypothetical protein